LTSNQQHCSKCLHIHKCRSRKTAYGNTLSDRNDIINLLVCRLKMGISVNDNTKILLQLFRPGMINLITNAKRRYSGNSEIDFDVMLMDMQSFMTEMILIKYKIGELNPITNFLFDIKSGCLVKWSQWYTTKQQRFASRHVLTKFNSNTDETDEYNIDNTPLTLVDNSLIEDPDPINYIDDVLKIVHDGVTLNTNEFLVFKACLHHANDSNSVRMIDGIHIKLSKILGVSRPRITRLFRRAKDKILIKLLQR
jgi:hypothetical protein